MLTAPRQSRLPTQPVDVGQLLPAHSVDLPAPGDTPPPRVRLMLLLYRTHEVRVSSRLCSAALEALLLGRVRVVRHPLAAARPAPAE